MLDLMRDNNVQSVIALANCFQGFPLFGVWKDLRGDVRRKQGKRLETDWYKTGLQFLGFNVINERLTE